MNSYERDVDIVRRLAAQYAEAAQDPRQEQRRRLWRRHNSLQPSRPPIIITYGMWNAWCEDVFGDQALDCETPFLREKERELRLSLFHDTLGDDFVLEPWITQRATLVTHPEGHWGVRGGDIASSTPGGRWRFDPPLKEWGDTDALRTPHHVVDEEQTARDVTRLEEAVGDLLPVNVDRGPVFQSFHADISTDIALLRGHEQIMLDLIEAPDRLHELLTFMRDAILTVHEEAERAGDWSLTSQENQCMCYCEELEQPQANSGPRQREQLWTYCASQEFTGVSPAMHDEFLLQYQIPIVERFGLTAYGCCEDLTQKIDILRQIPNLRIIAVTPSADVAACAEQIGTDYVISWRPNPTDMVCASFDEGRIRRIIGEGLRATRGCHVHIHLKDVETVQGEPERLADWVRIVRDVIDTDGDA